MRVSTSNGTRVDVCVEYEKATGPLTGAALWQMRGEQWRPCAGLRARLFRRSHIKRQLRAMMDRAAVAHPRWHRAMLKVFLPLHTRHRHTYRYRAWRVLLVRGTAHLVLWLPITPRLRLGADLHFYLRTANTRTWHSLTDDHLHCWLGKEHVIYVVRLPRALEQHGPPGDSA